MFCDKNKQRLSFEKDLSPYEKYLLVLVFLAFGSFKEDLSGILDEVYYTFFYEAYSYPLFLFGFLWLFFLVSCEENKKLQPDWMDMLYLGIHVWEF